jgi:hypothetical protein
MSIKDKIFEIEFNLRLLGKSKKDKFVKFKVLNANHLETLRLDLIKKVKKSGYSDERPLWSNVLVKEVIDDINECFGVK